MASPSLLNDANALLYSAKSFAAAMLAYYIALSIGLERPSWAIITVYIVSQTSVGASLSRSLYRLVGTVVGAGITVLIVPAFVNMPLFFSVILTGWITFCLYLSLLERTPRAYGFVLAGYTASLIGFPAVSDPSAIFNIAIVRVQEIMIGIFCAALIHRYVLPARITGQFNSKLSQTLLSARQRVADTLAGKPDAVSGPLHMALALQFLQGISHHIPYDFSYSVPVRQARKRLHDRLARLVIVNCELRDRLALIATIPVDVQILLGDVEVWLACKDEGKFKSEAEALKKRSEKLLQRYSVYELTFEEALRVSFMRYLLEAIVLVQQCYRLSDAIHHAKQTPAHSEKNTVKGYVFHRDPLTAARTALGAFAIIMSGCLVWIFSAWPDGGTAVSILGVCCTLFGSFDTPAPHIVKYIIGSFWGVVISLIYSFVLLPQVSDFIVLVTVLAPVYLLAGSLQARPPTTFMAMGITLTLPILCELGAHYSGDFAVAVNTSIALFSATGFAVLGMSLLQTVQADSAIKRLLQLCQRDINRSVEGKLNTDETLWTNLMIDRAALILPRLQRSGQSPERAHHLLYAMRIGLCVMRLRRCDAHANKEIKEVLTLLTHSTDIDTLLQRIASLTERSLSVTDELSRHYVDQLVDLYCALSVQKMEPANDQ
ncbi:FUSC family protein [Citrobacter freundii]|nr:FUSC family protein [Citrobacter freundii]MCT1469223.1 FUSC family protein [Citrobacter freundii]MCT1498007.1 FUSC family protein [Citrobacter freundii]